MLLFYTTTNATNTSHKISIKITIVNSINNNNK